MVPFAGWFATGGKALKKGAEAVTEAVAEQGVKHAADAIAAGKTVAQNVESGATKTKPNQRHHFGTIYGDNAKRLQKEIDKYGLKLNGDWNKEVLPHLGRHTQDYHDEVYRLTQQAASEAGNDVKKFLERYEKYVKEWLRKNPDVMYKPPR